MKIMHFFQGVNWRGIIVILFCLVFWYEVIRLVLWIF